MRKVIVLFIVLNSLIFPQSHQWFPSQLNVQPFTANFLEPKAGFSYLSGQSKLRLDIGTSSDIYHYINNDVTISFGADLFTFTRLRGEGEFHFPVEAIDYLFGFNGAYKIEKANEEYGLRVRLSHISAHFVDGDYDYTIPGWRNRNNPRVYSREFLELFPYYRFNSFRVYAGLTYLIHVTPKNIGKGIYQAGFDYYFTSLTNLFSPFVAYDFKLSKIDKYSGSNILAVGVKFGYYKQKGLSLLVSYLSGKSTHGEYYDLNEKYVTFGINLDL